MAKKASLNYEAAELQPLDSIPIADDQHHRHLSMVLKQLQDGQTSEQIYHRHCTKGNWKPAYVKEIIREAAVEYAARLLAAGMTPSHVRSHLMIQLAVGIDGVKPIVARAIEAQGELLDMSTKELTAWAAEMYLKVFRSAQGNPRAQEKVLDGFCRLLGLFRQPATGGGNASLTFQQIVGSVEKEDRTPIIDADYVNEVVAAKSKELIEASLQAAGTDESFNGADSNGSSPHEESEDP